MARSKDTLNLDGLIRREDLESKAEMAKGSGGILPIQLEIGQHYYGLLRKPVFQRETDDWDIDNVVSLIRSFRDGHLIPAVILWAAEGNIFVIDGAHRLSAFIAWINDDYGDRATSEAYFGHHIPKKQKELAVQCRKRIDEAGLTYTELLKLSKIANRTEQQALWSVNITQPIEAQWVGGGAATALQSFLDINQRAVVIDKTERYMIEERRAPVIVAARAIVNAARGHKYWGSFDSAFVTAIEQKAKLIYDAIFEPEDAQPHKDIFLQPAGNARTAGGLRLSLDLVNLVNGISGRSSKLVADSDGSGTASAIEKTWGVVKYIGGGGSASLDLFPAVYFWGETGIHRPSGFLAMTSLVQDMLLGEELRKFTIHRARFEEFLIDKNGYVGRVLKKHGGWKKSLGPTKKMLRMLLDSLYEGKTEPEIEASLIGLLETKRNNGEDSDATFSSANTWRETKASMRIKAALDTAARCPICKARMVLPNSSDDHKTRRADGGSSYPDNGDLVHPYCNTGFKNYYDQRGEPLPAIEFP